MATIDNNKKIRVAITHGDTNGVGYEMIFKAFDAPEMLDMCTPIIYGSPKVASYHLKALGLQANFSIIHQAEEARSGRINLLTVFDEEIKVELGQAAEESGEAGLQAIDRALDDYKKGLVDVLVTAPIDNTDVFHFSGQSRYIEDHLDSDGQGLSVMVNEHMRVALATRNLPLKQVAECVTKESLKKSVKTLNDSLMRDFRISGPRIALLSLNPKGGDGGLLGTEEQDMITPAINELVEEGVQAFGPYAADGFFGTDSFTTFDGILAMYYDQGLAPFRALTADYAVNFTAGLPLVRTAPELSSTLYLAGKNMMDGSAMRHAIYLAIDIYRNRREFDAPLSSPLPKLYHEKRDESDKVRFAIPKKREDRVAKDKAVAKPQKQVGQGDANAAE